MSPVETPFLLSPDRSLQHLTQREASLRTEYIQVTIHPELPSPPELLKLSTELLELSLALAGFVEAAHQLGIGEHAEVVSRFGEIRQKARQITGLDPVDMVGRHPDLLPPLGAEPSRRDVFGEAALRSLIRAAASTIGACPIDTLEQIALSLDDEHHGSRCRNAYEGLKAFLRRNDPRADAVARTVGRAYAEGRLSRHEAARILGVSVPELLLFFEQNGYVRPLEVVALEDAEREALLARLGADRAARQGQPAEISDDLLRREVLATQRIEGIDARPWL